jgi:hypothetical protein
MAKFATNINGDWWEITEGDAITIIDTEDPAIIEALASEDVEIGEDKFEQFIAKYGDAVATI